MDSIYSQFPGGSDLIDWFDGEPRFHDAEIVSLNLHRGSTSTLNVHFWTSTGDRAQERPERAPYVLGTSPHDYEIALEDCRGISGWIRFQALSISLAPGKPKDSYF